MHDLASTFIILGSLFLLGLLTDVLGQRTRLPRVTLLLLCGFVIGSAGFDLLSAAITHWFPATANMALLMVGFLLGEKFTMVALRQHGRFVLVISMAAVVVTAAVVLLGFLLLRVPLAIALLLAGVAPATDPAATAEVVRETQADGPFARTLLGIVAVDDAWGLIVFSLMLAGVQVLYGQENSTGILLTSVWEISGALVVGIGLGLPAAYLTGRVRPGEPTLVEALGVVLLCGGIALWLEVSFLLAAMVMGAVVANLAHHHERPFHAIEGIEWPFMILFFIMAGASLRPGTLWQIGLVGGAYIGLRIAGRFLGGWIGGIASQAPPTLRRWIGTALMPQAGVAMGMALLASQRFPRFSEVILPVVVASTVLFEVLGPILTRYALARAGEIPTEAPS